MSKATPPALPEISPEFFIRVNDFIEMANRIERRFDTHHAMSAMTHAFARYSAHHYRSTVKGGDQQSREDFAAYMAGAVQDLVLTQVDDLLGPPAPKADSNDAPAE
jgi:hypothetical protein